jgi:hypothetical protein
VNFSGIDESVAVQGFAGTGKTFDSPVRWLLEPQRTLLLALTEGQLRALQARVKTLPPIPR